MKMTDDPVERRYLEISLDSPADGAVLTGPATGLPLDVAGAVGGNRVDPALVTVVVTYGRATMKAAVVYNPATGDATWEASLRPSAPGVLRLEAKATTGGQYGLRASSGLVGVTIQDTVPPHEVAVLAPAPGAAIPIRETGTDVPVTVRARDHLGIARVECAVDHTPAGSTLGCDSADPSLWRGTVPVSSMPLGNRTLTVRATDQAGNWTEASLAFSAQDNTPPALQITTPGEGERILWAGAGTRVPLSGTSQDRQSGVASVDWSTDGWRHSAQAQTSDSWAHWTANVPVPDFGFYEIQVRFKDAAGNSTIAARNFEAVSSFKPKSVEELLGPRAYLDALLAFVRDHVHDAADAALATDDLEAAFHQPFGRLKEPLSEVGDEPVTRLRVPLEVLREYQAARPALLAAHWRCNEPGGGTLGDGSAFGNSGNLLNGASFASVGDRQAVSFDGAQARLEIPNTPPLEVGKNGADFSVAFWLYLRQGFTGAWRAIAHKGASNQERTFAMWMRPNENRIHYRISTGANWNEGADRTTAEIALNTWTHIGYVKSGRQLNLYIDGVLDSSVTLAGSSVSNSGPIYLGSDPWYSGIDGALADVRVYQMALSQDSVRALIEPVPTAGPLPTEEGYRQAAYTSLLRSLGTSYEEIRLAPGMPAAERKGLADRLGISLGPNRPDALDLLLAPTPLTEPWLEQVFGLPDTNRRLADLPAAQPSLLGWQLGHLKEQWMIEDHPDPAGGMPARAIVDPDLIGLADLRNPVAGNLPFDLCQLRKAWVDGIYTSLKTTREAQATPLQGFDRVVADTLGGGVDLGALEASYRAGQDVRPALDALQLSLSAFLYLVRLRPLAQAGKVTDQEWSSLYSILTQVRKLREAAAWRAAEQSLSLSPEHFRLTATPPPLPAWRATEAARRAWQELLKARIAEQNALEEGLRSAVSAAEQAALPVLRDAILVAFAGPDAASQAGDQLVDHLLIDVKDSGVQQTTRNLQAAETLQQVLFALRTLALDPDHPAAGWKIVEEGADSAEQERNFDQELRWIGGADDWRAINTVFLYPENYLLPSLRELSEASPAFGKFLDRLRQTPILTPQQARQAASDYLGAVRANIVGLPASFALTEQLSKQELDGRRQLAQEAWAAAAPAVVSEVFYFVPMELALRLQKSGHYLAALGWYKTIYAYDLPLEKRKVSYILRRERNAAPQLDRDAHWLRKATNPHTIAANRPNPHTRFALMSLGRCLVEFADAEYAGDALGNARSLYLTARELLHLPELDLIPPTAVGQALLPNPALDVLRLSAETQLAKLRQGRNIAGVLRQVDLPSTRAPAGPQPAGAPSLPQRPPRPTPYRFSVIMERSKQLANIAQQIEAAYLGALKETSGEEYGRRKAAQDLNLAQAGVKLQGLRVTEAATGEGLATLQKQRAEKQAQHYEDLLNVPISQAEQESLDALDSAWGWLIASAAVSSAGAIAGAVVGGIAGYYVGSVPGAAGGSAGGAVAGALAQGLPGIAQALQSVSSSYSIHSQALSMQAGFERRKQEWEFQWELAVFDVYVGMKQEQTARDHSAVVRQEEAIAKTQTEQAQAMVDFLANKFLNTEMYEWMSEVLGGVYRFFLQQATAMARLAEMQLTFERQVTPRAFIESGYWEAPAEGSTATVSSSGAPDRRGLTGSARLLQDIYQLDQYAFETDKRKLNLTQTISLAQLAPFEFQRFRQTGVLPFATPMNLFDQIFPGHYLRLIKRVHTTVVALIPPNQGIRASLIASGISRVVVGGDRFEEVLIRRDPELVALTSPINATGVFELDVQPEMLFPFESMGVDTSWEFQLPKAANPFDFSTIADVLITIEYTALNSLDYRQQVVRRLDPSVVGNRTVGFRDQIPDAWYQLHNPDDPQAPLAVTFETTLADFPPNLQDLAIQNVLLHLVHGEDQDGGQPWDDQQLKASLSFNYTTDDGRKLTFNAETQPDGGTVSTRRGNGAPWKGLIGQTPVGKWTLSLPREANTYFQANKIQDILFIITFAGRTPPWPA